MRTKFSLNQKHIEFLETLYKNNPNPNSEEIKRISKDSSLPMTTLKTWYHARRQDDPTSLPKPKGRARKRVDDSTSKSTSTSTPVLNKSIPTFNDHTKFQHTIKRFSKDENINNYKLNPVASIPAHNSILSLAQPNPTIILNHSQTPIKAETPNPVISQYTNKKGLFSSYPRLPPLEKTVRDDKYKGSDPFLYSLTGIRINK